MFGGSYMRRDAEDDQPASEESRDEDSKESDPIEELKTGPPPRQAPGPLDVPPDGS
jgi:hypothetical protein